MFETSYYSNLNFTVFLGRTPNILERIETMAKYKKSMMRSSNYEFEPWKFDGDINHYHIPSYT
ncbi:hypothetical protein FDE92_09365 [Clostridium botulinum]|uniref:hypothetical protein n=1 Tax=Clostridium botulinum TaxID=1491 RepID=UPI000947A273|nr:hypothetical protein [Clostridium botulinum]AWB17547.1 hypothetical protein DB732_08710 [Clostridium botulinum]AWB30334.1 hypothetical protein DBN47_08680 [Clostridium botulinum]EGT5615864.1 hypothetical protein [Clostridium botulinum]EGT5622746.1 hypothetical protein [Clostridium botulinum]EGT5625223.1 hypothetical protein [Clostridium botulinum]